MSQQRREETERGGGGARLGHDLMQRAAGQPALRQMTIDGGKAEGDWSGRPQLLHFGQ